MKLFDRYPWAASVSRGVVRDIDLKTGHGHSRPGSSSMKCWRCRKEFEVMDLPTKCFKCPDYGFERSPESRR